MFFAVSTTGGQAWSAPIDVSSRNEGTTKSAQWQPWSAVNPLGDSKDLILVKPGDPEASFLVQKLRLTSALDTHLGSGMPADAPGSICASSVDVVAQF